jgi:hypothetical protein
VKDSKLPLDDSLQMVQDVEQRFRKQEMDLEQLKGTLQAKVKT